MNATCRDVRQTIKIPNLLGRANTPNQQNHYPDDPKSDGINRDISKTGYRYSGGMGLNQPDHPLKQKDSPTGIKTGHWQLKFPGARFIRIQYWFGHDTHKFPDNAPLHDGIKDETPMNLNQKQNLKDWIKARSNDGKGKKTDHQNTSDSKTNPSNDDPFDF